MTNTSGTAVTFNGLITLGSASSIVAGNGDILLPNIGNITGITFGLTLDGSATGNSLAGNLTTTTGTLTKTGSGTWAISGNSTYTGATTINAGTLKLTGGSLANTAIAVSGTGILAVQPGSSTTINVGTTVTATVGATLNLGAQTFDMADGFVSTVNLRQGSTFANNALTVTSGATFRMNLGEAATDLLAVIKKASVSGTIDVTLDTAGASALTAGTYNLITAASGLTSSSPTWQFSGGGVTQTVTVGAGSYDLTLNASDTAVSVTVVNSSTATPYDNWAASKGLDGTPGKEKGLTDDPDGDGHNNLAEFAFNGDPLSGSDNGQVYVLQADSDADGDSTKELILTLAVRKTTGAFTAGAPATATSATDSISYAIEGSLNLSAFDATVTPVGFVDPGVALTDATYYEYRSFSLSGSNGLTTSGFLRATTVK